MRYYNFETIIKNTQGFGGNSSYWKNTTDTITLRKHRGPNGDSTLNISGNIAKKFTDTAYPTPGGTPAFRVAIEVDAEAEAIRLFQDLSGFAMAIPKGNYFANGGLL